MGWACCGSKRSAGDRLLFVIGVPVVRPVPFFSRLLCLEFLLSHPGPFHASCLFFPSHGSLLCLPLLSLPVSSKSNRVVLVTFCSSLYVKPAFTFVSLRVPVCAWKREKNLSNFLQTRPFISFIALLWMLLRASMSFYFCLQRTYFSSKIK